MTTATIGYRLAQSKTKSKSIRAFKFISINYKFICFLAATILLLSAILYIYLINDLTKGTYLIKNYSREIESLSNENSSLESTFAESNFLAGIRDRANELNFKKTTDIKYIQVVENSLAQASGNIK